MLKASALYLVIVIALVIAILCSSLIVVAYVYRAEYQKKSRYEKLQNNLASGINILLASADTAYNKERIFNLFDNGSDSISLAKTPWGIYDVCVAKSFMQRDTLAKAFTIANGIDSSKWAVLYLIDEDRPLSLSGKTNIRGNAFIPKAGLLQAYINNSAYQGDKRMIVGKKQFSAKILPPLDPVRLNLIDQYFAFKGDTLANGDSIRRSFLNSPKIFDFKKQVKTLNKVVMQGNIIIRSDTTVFIDSTAHLENVLLFAKVIIVKSGFSGRCQLFAKDSVVVGKHCTFEYPSGIGVIRMTSTKSHSQRKITLGEGTTFGGLLFTFENNANELLPLVMLCKGDTLRGQVYSQGILELNDGVDVQGSVFTAKFLYKGSPTLYENYLINATLDAPSLSPYYLTSGMLPVASKKKKVLQWIEMN